MTQAQRWRIGTNMKGVRRNSKDEGRLELGKDMEDELSKPNKLCHHEIHTFTSSLYRLIKVEPEWLHGPFFFFFQKSATI